MSHSALLLQLVILLRTALVLGALFCCCGQPGVIGEMAAGGSRSVGRKARSLRRCS
jgi:Kef-type K+ transport system membrane component KefB